ncbi:MAG: peptide ABC transporter substrate-binding protein, partial [Syntrophus sp. (in: bacteria)]|nr:peptide ABC transporter substrate-binding protein [Syntrophus sp. (in: bacteria)]
MGTLLSVSELKKTYEVRKTVFSIKKDIIRAVDGVSFALEKGKTLGIVGESGSGKSTLVRCILLLERPDSGKIMFNNTNLLEASHAVVKDLRRDMQIIFQDPYSSLNPRKRVFDTLAEPLLFHEIVEKKDLAGKVMEILHNVGLDEDFLKKYPHEMSGGQRQRVAIGRALATGPQLIVADEPISSLDVSIQAQIINLFLDIREGLGISMLFVSHDLNIVRFVSDDIIVMYQGKVVEMGARDEVFFSPLHPYTKMLINAAKGQYNQSEGNGMLDTFNGCPYYPKCDKREPACEHSVPVLTGPENHKAACF